MIAPNAPDEPAASPPRIDVPPASLPANAHAAILRVPPHDLEAERAVLGACLIDPDAALKAVEILDAEHFYSSAHARLFQAIRRIVDAGRVADPLIVIDELTRAGDLEQIGGRPYLAELAGTVESGANIRHWSKIIRGHAVRRRVIAAASDLSRGGFDGESNETLAEIAQRVVGETEFASDSHPTLAKSLDEVIDAIESPLAIRGVPTTYDALDSVLGRMEPGTLHLLGARPSMGKTALGLNIALNLALMGVSVAFVSLEMSRHQVMRRLLSIQSGVPMRTLKGGNALTPKERESVALARDAIVQSPLVIENGEFTTTSLRARVTRLKAQQGIELAVVDYLALLRAPPDLRTIRSQIDLVTHVSASLKGTAVSTGVPVLALCQLSRANAKENESAEKAEDIRWPGLTDLRDSGSLEQDADSVMFLHRDAYYTKDHHDFTARVIVAKNRDGETGDVGLTWIPTCQQFRAQEFK